MLTNCRWRSQHWCRRIPNKNERTEPLSASWWILMNYISWRPVFGFLLINFLWIDFRVIDWWAKKQKKMLAQVKKKKMIYFPYCHCAAFRTYLSLRTAGLQYLFVLLDKDGSTVGSICFERPLIGNNLYLTVIQLTRPSKIISTVYINCGSDDFLNSPLFYHRPWYSSGTRREKGICNQFKTKIFILLTHFILFFKCTSVYRI